MTKPGAVIRAGLATLPKDAFIHESVQVKANSQQISQHGQSAFLCAQADNWTIRAFD